MQSPTCAGCNRGVGFHVVLTGAEIITIKKASDGATNPAYLDRLCFRYVLPTLKSNARPFLYMAFERVSNKTLFTIFDSTFSCHMYINHIVY